MQCRANNRAFTVGATVALLIFLFAAESGYCQQFIKARVADVDTSSMELTVMLLSDPTVEQQKSEPGTVTVRLADKNNLPVEKGITRFPGCVVKGDIIRLWGKEEPDNSSLFWVTDIRGCRHGGCSDPTGVRSRLTRYPKNRFGCEQPSEPTDLEADRRGDVTRNDLAKNSVMEKSVTGSATPANQGSGQGRGGENGGHGGGGGGGNGGGGGR